MKIFSLGFFILLSSIVFSQSWHASQGGKRYQLVKNSTGVYTLSIKFSSGDVCKSKLTRNSVRYDNPSITGVIHPTTSVEYCKETMISGPCTAWSGKIIVCMHQQQTSMISNLTLVVDDGFDSYEISFYKD
jgi:hypothetical protein